MVTGIPLVDDKDAILVVVDRLSKMKHYIATTKQLGAEALADLYVQHVFKYHGLPRTVVSDRGPQFVSQFWRYLYRRLGSEAKLSSAFHPETDGQTERSNATMEEYLRAFTNYVQDDWVCWLPLAEFAANNTTSAATGISLFFVNLGQDPRMGLETIDPPTSPPELTAERFATHTEELNTFLREQMQMYQAEYKQTANRRRRPAPKYRLGQSVWLIAKNIHTRRRCRKLDNKRIGPYEIIEVSSPTAVRLDVPAELRIHDVFHINLIDPAADDALPGQVHSAPLSVIEDGEEEYLIEAILDCQRNPGTRKGLHWLIAWTGSPDPTWEPWNMVSELNEHMEKFYRRYPDKPRHRTQHGLYY